MAPRFWSPCFRGSCSGPSLATPLLFRWSDQGTTLSFSWCPHSECTSLTTSRICSGHLRARISCPRDPELTSRRANTGRFLREPTLHSWDARPQDWRMARGRLRVGRVRVTGTHGLEGLYSWVRSLKWKTKLGAGERWEWRALHGRWRASVFLSQTLHLPHLLKSQVCQAIAKPSKHGLSALPSPRAWSSLAPFRTENPYGDWATSMPQLTGIGFKRSHVTDTSWISRQTREHCCGRAVPNVVLYLDVQKMGRPQPGPKTPWDTVRAAGLLLPGILQPQTLARAPSLSHGHHSLRWTSHAGTSLCHSASERDGQTTA